MEVKKWDIFEVCLRSPYEGNPFKEVTLEAEFTNGTNVIKVYGFYDGNDTYRIRFMPAETGSWKYITSSNLPKLNSKEGEFTCILPEADNHGTVRVKSTFHFQYDDGTVYYPIGTTCYAWIYQSEGLQQKTLETLRKSPFNKIRMCVFPKYYDYNRTSPDIYPYEGNEEEGFHYDRPNPKLFQLLEKRVKQLGELGIEADLILFHPYEKEQWGFNIMGREADDLYLNYIVARLSAYRNVWWSLANEYDLFRYLPNAKGKDLADWNRFLEIIAEKDPYKHLRSIHNCMEFFDHTNPLITHCSIQRTDGYRTSENTDEWRKKYNKPVVIDECAYEGNINHSWGNITGEELTRRFWEGAVRGGYTGHGETYVHPQDILWWSHGGELHGTSPARIQFMRDILEEHSEYEISPLFHSVNDTCGGVDNMYYLFYYGFNQPAFCTFDMIIPRIKYTVELIDTWNMTVTMLPGTYAGEFRIDMPGRQYMAVRMLAVPSEGHESAEITEESTIAEIVSYPGGETVIKMLEQMVKSEVGGDITPNMRFHLMKMSLKQLKDMGQKDSVNKIIERILELQEIKTHY